MNLFTRVVSVFLTVYFYGMLSAEAKNEAIVDLDSTHQRIRGFGGANILPWRPDMTDSEIRTAFGMEEGQLGLSMLRLMIDPDKNNWSLNVRTAQKAHEMGVLIFASPWNAPASMLQTVNGIKKIRPEKYEDYAEHLNEFVDFMEARGVPIYAVSVQNEPDFDGGWTQWSASEMLTFMRDYASLLITRVIAPESFQFRREMSDPFLNDPIACENVDIIGGHIYGAGLAPYPLAKSKGKEVWMTEHYTDSQNSGNLWPLALEVGKEMHEVMCADMNAYVWWYIVRYYGPISDGTMDSGKKGEMTKRGYVMSHFSRFVRPGYRRLECTPRPQNSVYTSAYIDSAFTRVVLVVVNMSAFAKSQTFIFRDGRIERLIPYITSENANCERKQEISLSSDTLQIELAARSIMTLVSEGKVALGLRSEKEPQAFILLPNYPNPFNAVTAIRFRIPRRSDVALTIYNLKGEVLEKISCGIHDAGEHTIPFEAKRLPSGVYLYRLTAGDFSAVGRMVLAR